MNALDEVWIFSFIFISFWSLGKVGLRFDKSHDNALGDYWTGPSQWMTAVCQYGNKHHDGLEVTSLFWAYYTWEVLKCNFNMKVQIGESWHVSGVWVALYGRGRQALMQSLRSIENRIDEKQRYLCVAVFVPQAAAWSLCIDILVCVSVHVIALMCVSETRWSIKPIWKGSEVIDAL